jgi:hypothetical protein
LATGKSGIEIKNKGLLLFGAILLLIGLVASFYAQVRMESVWKFDTQPPNYGHFEVEETSRSYPYQGIGIILVAAGIVFIALGFFYPSQRTPPPPPPQKA